MKVFLDTNVLASALMGRGLCRDLLDHLILDHEVVLGEPVREELNRIVRTKFQAPPALFDWMNRKLDALTQAPASRTELPAIPDPDDAPILACALAANVELFVTGDRALLALQAVRNMPIVSLRDCWDRLLRQR